MDLFTGIVVALVLLIGLCAPYYIWYSAAGKRKDTPGSPGGSPAGTPTLGRTLVAPDRLALAQTMRAGLITEIALSRHRADVRRRG